MMFMHIRTHIAVVPVAQDRDIIEKNVRALQAELVEPAVFGNDVFDGSIRKVVVSLHSEKIVRGKSWHG